ncbi:hypothetical protein [Algibacter sp. Ld11]|uniref:hypothetical protein n=1 Tax=Algibacter sp. Ld11 TaxID=649150 RepID=UPI00387036B3
MKITIKIYLLISINALFISCDYEDKEIIDKMNTVLSNGRHLEVEKTTTLSTAIGLFSGHNYGTTHRFTYKLRIEPEDVTWDGGSGEPKSLLFFKDTTYIYFLKEKVIRKTYTDSITNTLKEDSYTEIHAFYQKHIDMRYFFKFFGDDYWVDIPHKDFNAIKHFSNEFAIPNDNELSLKPMDSIGFKN